VPRTHSVLTATTKSPFGQFYQYHRVAIVPPPHPQDDVEIVAVIGFGLLDLDPHRFGDQAGSASAVERWIIVVA
jgi:hypothetical protein